MAAKKKPVVMAPELTATVGGEVHYLAPTLTAVRKITAFCGGIRPAFDRVRAIDFDAMAQILIAGAGLEVAGKDYDDLVTSIWQEENKAKLGGDLTAFLSVLLNGGRALPDLGDDADEDGETPGKS